MAEAESVAFAALEVARKLLDEAAPLVDEVAVTKAFVDGIEANVALAAAARDQTLAARNEIVPLVGDVAASRELVTTKAGETQAARDEAVAARDQVAPMAENVATKHDAVVDAASEVGANAAAAAQSADVATAAAAAAAIAATTISAGSWAALVALTPAFIGQRAQVSANDAGTHTGRTAASPDIDVAGVANSGVYGAFAKTTAGAWRRDAPLSPIASASDAQARSAIATDVALTPASGRAGDIASIDNYGSYPLLASAKSLISGLGWIEDIVLYTGDPAKVRYVRFAAYHYSGNNALFQVNQCDPDGANDGVLCSFSSSNVTWSGRLVIPLNAAGVNVVVGHIVLVVPTGSPTSPATAGSYTATTLRADRLRASASWDSEIQRQISVQHEFGLFEAPTSGNTRSNVNVLAARIKDIAIYGADKSRKPYIKYLYYHDIGTRFGIEVWIVDADGASDDAVYAKYALSDVTYTGVVLLPLTSSGTASGTPLGYILIDFGDGATAFTLAPSPASWATAGIKRDRVIGDTGLLSWISSAQASGGVTVAGSKKPFIDAAPSVSAVNIVRNTVRNVWIYNAGKEDQWYVERIYKAFGAGGYARIWLKRASDGLTLQWTAQLIAAENLPRDIRLFYMGASSDDPGIFAQVEMDWSAYPVGGATYSGYADTGIHRDSLFTTLETAALCEIPRIGRTYSIGTGRDFDTLSAAITALDRSYGAGVTLSTQFYRGVSDLAWPHSWVELQLYDAGLSPVMLNGRHYPIVHELSGAIGQHLQEYVFLRGMSPDAVLIKNTAGAVDHTLQANANVRLENITVSSEGVSLYAIHLDPAGTAQPDRQTREIRTHYKNVRTITGPSGTRSGIGSGVFGGQVIRLESCRNESLNPSGVDHSYLFHNTAQGNKKPPRVELLDCSGNDKVRFQSLGNGTVGHARVVGGNFSLMVVEDVGDVADIAVRRREWLLTGAYDGPVLMYDKGMVVLAATPGVSVGGAAAAALFGTIDELGRGSKCVRPRPTDGGNAWYPSAGYLDTSLAARLGNRTSDPWDLTIGAQTVTLNADYSSMATATILSAINAIVTANPVSMVNISMEDYPMLGGTTRLYNASGVTIGNASAPGPGRGVFVKRTGLRTIVAAADGDDVIGWCPRPVPHNSWGLVVTASRFHAGYIFGATSGGDLFTPVLGQFGIGSDGRFSTVAARKIGFIDAGANVILY